MLEQQVDFAGGNTNSLESSNSEKHSISDLVSMPESHPNCAEGKINLFSSNLLLYASATFLTYFVYSFQAA